MKILILSCFVLFLFISGCKKDVPDFIHPTKPPVDTTTPPKVYTEKEIYYYSYISINGDSVKLRDFKGKKIMFVNTASFCSNTPQYEKLEELYKTYSAKLVIIGFPCNQFGQQEPGDDSTIKDFCTDNYQVTFPMASKIDVKGTGQHPVYKWLTTKDLNGKLDSQVDWNFQKYLVDENGLFMAMFPDGMQPDHPAIIQEIEK